jgi:hypothetical protein
MAPTGTTKEKQSFSKELILEWIVASKQQKMINKSTRHRPVIERK